MRRILMAVLILALGGCASLFNGWMGLDFDLPGRGVDERAAQQWGCQADQVQTAAAENRRGLGLGQTYTPQVGWTACELMAHVGAPRDYELQQTTEGRSASLWYGKPADPHLVTVALDSTRGVWIVNYVSW